MNNNDKSKNNFGLTFLAEKYLDAGIFASILIFTAYSNAYVYYKGYTSHFAIPLDYVNISVDNVLYINMLFFLFIILLTLCFADILHNEYEIKFKNVFVRYSFFIPVTYYFFWYSQRIYILLVMSIIGIGMMFLRYSLPGRVEREQIKTSFSKNIWIILLAFYFFNIGSSTYRGHRSAIDQYMFQVIENEKRDVVLLHFEDKFVCAQLDSANYYSSFVVADYEKLCEKKQKIVVRNIGKLIYTGLRLEKQ